MLEIIFAKSDVHVDMALIGNVDIPVANQISKFEFKIQISLHLFTNSYVLNSYDSLTRESTYSTSLYLSSINTYLHLQFKFKTTFIFKHSYLFKNGIH